MILLFCLLFTTLGYAQEWQLGPFHRPIDKPILSPNPATSFICPLQNKKVHWEKAHVFNPAAIVRKGKVYLLYRAEDGSGNRIGGHTSRIGLARSNDGIHFQRLIAPVFYPDLDSQQSSEWAGGCEDPRIVESEDGTYIMTYTQWNRDSARLAVATSKDLLHWKKHGYVFADAYQSRWSKSGSIVCELKGDRLIAAKIQGSYWMYWGEGSIFSATSTDLIHWKPILDEAGEPLPVLEARPDKFDSALVEPGPPALLTKQGILLLYNGKNSKNGDSTIRPGAYSAGQLLLDPSNPSTVLARSENCFLKPEASYETSGQYRDGTVFIQGLVYFKEKWLLYYGAADTVIGVATSVR